ncbi:hypothetical protein F5Y17DRAFT_192636 [Xylariaceae sp. FL0594]|nr:hypothetical protein F5Y17DRAFT_192636 [Xylariaceae sp. FL0594]
MGAIDAKSAAKPMLAQHSLELVSLEKIQALWAGYGHICRVVARASDEAAAARLRDMFGEDIGVRNAKGEEEETVFPLILKLISPPPRRTTTTTAEVVDEGHLRKVFSYEVEQNFYRDLVPRLGDGLAVARCLAVTQESFGSGSGSGKDIKSQDGGGSMAILMTDLRIKYPVAGEKRAVLNEKQVHSALRWLSDFHKRSWQVLPMSEEEKQKLLLPPKEEAKKRLGRRNKAGTATSTTSVWLNGGYTYLATRRKEYASLAADDESEWAPALCNPVSSSGTRSIAEMAAHILAPRGRECETLIHGDVKSENLFTTEDGSEVAFYDFQYVGLGLGVCDLAKLFTCSVPVSMLKDEDDYSDERSMHSREKALLAEYRENLVSGTGKVYDWDTFVRHWETALVDWLRFQASWGFWGNTEWLEARVRSILKDEKWRRWLEKELNEIDKSDISPAPI